MSEKEKTGGRRKRQIGAPQSIVGDKTKTTLQSFKSKERIPPQSFEDKERQQNCAKIATKKQETEEKELSSRKGKNCIGSWGKKKLKKSIESK